MHCLTKKKVRPVLLWRRRQEGAIIEGLGGDLTMTRADSYFAVLRTHEYRTMKTDHT